MHPATKKRGGAARVFIHTHGKKIYACAHICILLLPFTIDQNQIDGGSQYPVVTASGEYNRPTRNELVVNLPVGMTSVRVVLHHPSV